MARRKFTNNCEAIQVSPCGWDVIANGEKIGEIIDHTHSSLADYTDELWEGINFMNDNKRFKTIDEAIYFVYNPTFGMWGTRKWHA